MTTPHEGIRARDASRMRSAKRGSRSTGDGSEAHASPSLAAERALVGAALLGADFAQQVVAAVGPQHLDDPRLAAVLRAVVERLAQGGGTDPLSVAEALGRRLADVGGTTALLDLLQEAEALAGAQRVAEHAAIVVAAAERRRVVAALGAAAAAAAAGAPVDELRQHLRVVAAEPDPEPVRPVRDWRAVADDPPVSWLADGLLPARGLVVLAGEPGSGKTLLALDLALRAAHGLDWLGRRIAPTSTLYCAGEGAAGLGARLRAWTAAHPGSRPLAGRTVAIVDGVPDLVAQPGELRRLVDDHRRAHGALPGLVVVDTLAMAAPAADENDAGAMGAVLRALTEIAALGICVVLLHHTRKPAEGQRQGGQAAVRGSSAIVGAADVVLIAGARDDAHAIAAAKVRDGERPEPIRYRIAGQPTGRTRTCGTPEYGPVVLPAAAPAAAAAPTTTPAEAMVASVVAVLRGIGTPTSKETVCTAHGGKQSTARAAFDLALGRGQIVRAGGTSRRPLYVAGGVAATPHTPRRDGTGSSPPSPPSPDGTGRLGTGRDGTTYAEAHR